MSRPVSDRPSSSFSFSSSYGIHRTDDSQKVRYEIFKRCADITDDIEWKNIFRKMSKGIFMDNFRFDGVSLRYTRVRKGQSAAKNEPLKIGEEAPEECERIQKYIRSKTGYQTTAEKAKMRLNYEESASEAKISKKVNVLFQVLYNYLEKQGELDKEHIPATVYELIDLVHSGDLPLSDIVVTDSEICDIPGLEVSGGCMQYTNLRKRGPCTHVDIFSLSG